MKPKILVIGASGTVGTHVVKELEKTRDKVEIIYSTSKQEKFEQWKKEGHNTVLLDLNKKETILEALKGVERVFLLTGYTTDMLFQSKNLVDCAKISGVKHIVHLGVFTSREDQVPHFVWHDLIETYIEASGISWTHLHPNVISETVLATNPPLKKTQSFSAGFGEAKQGWVFAEDIGAVSAKVLVEGPEKHAGKNYFLSTELLTGKEVAKILSDASGKNIQYNFMDVPTFKSHMEKIQDPGIKAYMESGSIYMKLASENELKFQTVVTDDVSTILGRPGMTMAEWGKKYLSDS